MPERWSAILPILPETEFATTGPTICSAILMEEIAVAIPQMSTIACFVFATKRNNSRFRTKQQPKRATISYVKLGANLTAVEKCYFREGLLSADERVKVRLKHN